MSEGNDTNGSEIPENVGAGGGLDLEAGDTPLHATRILERATRQRWPIPDEYRQPIVNRQATIAIDPNSSPRAASIATRCILEMERQNQQDEHHAEGSTLHVEHAAADVQQLANEMRQEEDYVQYIRDRASTSDTDAGAVRQVGLIADSGTVANGEPHGGSGPGANGSSNGDQ